VPLQSNFVTVASCGIAAPIDADVHSAPPPPPVFVGLAEAEEEADVGAGVGLADVAVSVELEQPAMTSVAAPAIDRTAAALPDFFETRTIPPS